MDTKVETPPPTQQPPKFYKKELVSNRLSLPNGRAVAFEQIGGTDSGVLATTDAGLSAELDKAAGARRGGVTQITEQQYQELKKNLPAGRSQIRSLDAQSLRHLLQQKPERNAAVVEVKHEPSAPMEVTKGLATISSRRKLKELTEKTSQRVAQGVAGTPPLQV